MSLPLISVCIANYNGMAVIDDCIGSVLAQEGRLAVEIIVHDDASNDDSAAYIRDRYPQVRLIASPDNAGFCVANKRMADAARGKYLLLLNNDAALYPDALLALLQAARQLGRPAILSLPQYEFDSGRLLDRGCLLDPFLNPIPHLSPRAGDVGMVMGACLWLPKALWEELGGFPDWFGSVGEDLYLCCRARLAGHPVRVPEASGYRHRVGHSFGGGKIQDRRLASTFLRRTLTERNKTFVMVVACPPPWMQLMLPLHVLLLFIEGSLLSLLKLDARFLPRIYLPVFIALFRHGEELRLARSAAQRQRRITSAEFFGVFDWMPYKLRMLMRYGLPRLT